MVLKSVLNSDPRVREAATMPFKSMQLGKDMGQFAVTLLQVSLRQIQLNSFFLPTRLRPRSKGPDGERFGFQWGPFDMIEDDEKKNRIFGGGTLAAVAMFQRQDGLDHDGKAGMITLSRLDEILHFIENNGPPPRQ